MTALVPAGRRICAPAAVLVGVGIACVVLGGLVAAVTGPLDLSDGSWAAAYLVLVAGVGQVAMGYARTWPTSPPVDVPGVAQAPSRAAWAQVGCWNAGNLVVIGGTLADRPWVVDVGSALLVVALVIALLATRHMSPQHEGDRLARLRLEVYRTLLVVLGVSIPVGMLLAAIRHP